MILLFKKFHPDAKLPIFAHPGDAGGDLVAVTKEYVPKDGFYFHTKGYQYIEYSTELGVRIPDGYVGLLFPRSSVSQTDLQLANSVGVIDSSYRGPVKFRYRLIDGENSYQVGERVGQLVIVPVVTYSCQDVDQLDSSSRGLGGFGSSGV